MCELREMSAGRSTDDDVECVGVRTRDDRDAALRAEAVDVDAA